MSKQQDDVQTLADAFGKLADAVQSSMQLSGIYHRRQKQLVEDARRLLEKVGKSAPKPEPKDDGSS